MDSDLPWDRSVIAAMLTPALIASSTSVCQSCFAFTAQCTHIFPLDVLSEFSAPRSLRKWMARWIHHLFCHSLIHILPADHRLQASFLENSDHGCCVLKSLIGSKVCTPLAKIPQGLSHSSMSVFKKNRKPDLEV